MNLTNTNINTIKDFVQDHGLLTYREIQQIQFITSIFFDDKKERRKEILNLTAKFIKRKKYG